MDLNKLRKELSKLGINEQYYSLIGGLHKGAYCIDRIDSEWEGYFCNNYKKYEKTKFSSEDEACSYFLKKITSDGAVMKSRETKN